MNIKYIFSLFNRIFLVKKSIENQTPDRFQNLLDNIQIYTSNFNNLSYNDRIMIHTMINTIT